MYGETLIVCIFVLFLLIFVLTRTGSPGLRFRDTIPTVEGFYYKKHPLGNKDKKKDTKTEEEGLVSKIKADIVGEDGLESKIKHLFHHKSD